MTIDDDDGPGRLELATWGARMITVIRHEGGYTLLALPVARSRGNQPRMGGHDHASPK